MPIAAVPVYLGKDFSSASPGLRFGMYLKLWGVNSRSQAKLWTTYDENYRVAGKDKQERLFKDENKGQALRDAVPLTRADIRHIKGLAARQSALRAKMPAHALLHLPATAVAPFATGLGNEHPLENGFAFLNPYGLPYLPGSGVKGVLRQAARELARGEWGDRRGWSDEAAYVLHLDGGKVVRLSMIDVLFGRETESGDTEHVRGVLSFWDVVPQIAGDKLHVEVMTPHQTHYYQNGQSPHDSGQPNPILFLTVPPQSKFDFHVVCDLPALRRIAPALAEGGQWQQALQATFAHAFAWLGFGAKTAVGYGAMEPTGKEMRGIGDARAPAAASTVAATTAEWHPAKLVWDKGRQELKAVAQGKSTAPVKKAEEARKLFTDPTLFERLAKKGELPNARVQVRIDGNMIALVKVF